MDGLTATAQIRSTESEWNLALKEAAAAPPPPAAPASISSNPQSVSASGHSSTTSRLLPSAITHLLPIVKQNSKDHTNVDSQNTPGSPLQTISREQESWNDASSSPSDNSGWLAASTGSPRAAVASPAPSTTSTPVTIGSGSAPAVVAALASVTAASATSAGGPAVASSPSGHAVIPSHTGSSCSEENSTSAQAATGTSQNGSSTFSGNTAHRGPYNTVVRQIHIPIIACTASAMDSDAEICRTAGMDDVMHKPIHHVELKTKLKQVAFRWQHSQRQLRRLTRQTLNAATMAAQLLHSTSAAPTTVQEGEEGHPDSQINANLGLYSTPSPQLRSVPSDAPMK